MLTDKLSSLQISDLTINGVSSLRSTVVCVDQDAVVEDQSVRTAGGRGEADTDGRRSLLAEDRLLSVSNSVM